MKIIFLFGFIAVVHSKPTNFEDFCKENPLNENFSSDKRRINLKLPSVFDFIPFSRIPVGGLQFLNRNGRAAQSTPNDELFEKVGNLQKASEEIRKSSKQQSGGLFEEKDNSLKPFEEIIKSSKQSHELFKEMGISTKPSDKSFEEMENLSKPSYELFEEMENTSKPSDELFEEMGSSEKKSIVFSTTDEDVEIIPLNGTKTALEAMNSTKRFEEVQNLSKKIVNTPSSFTLPAKFYYLNRMRRAMEPEEPTNSTEPRKGTPMKITPHVSKQDGTTSVGVEVEKSFGDHHAGFYWDKNINGPEEGETNWGVHVVFIFN